MKTVAVNMPQMGQSAAEGVIVKWRKTLGEFVQADEILVEVESDKISIEVESAVSGKLLDTVAVGTAVPVGEAIAHIEVEGPSEEPKPHAADTGGVQELVCTRAMPNSIAMPEMPEFTSDWLSPGVMRFALLNHITAEELKALNGSGKNGRVTRDDVLRYAGHRASTKNSIEKPAAAPAIREGDEIKPMTTIRRTIADHMVQSIHTSAHVTMVHSVDMTHFVALRDRVKDAFFNRYGVKMTYTGLLIFITARVLPRFPMINASVVGTNILVRRQINIGCAVALQDESLVVPVVKDADKKTFPEIAQNISELIARAKLKALSRADIEDGTFTISNFGSFGSIMGTPIINQPQVGIIGVGAIFKTPVLNEGRLETRDSLYLNFSFDHRVIDGALGGRFLNAIQTAAEAMDPTTLGLADLV